MLPVRLGKKPLIDVVCGIVFESENTGDVFLPALFLSKFPDKNLIFEQLPAHNIPMNIRGKDENLKHTAVLKAKMDEHYEIIIGSKVLGIRCIMPYQGWNNFLTKICEVVGALNDCQNIKLISRYSLRYVDLLEESIDTPAFSKLKIDISIGDIKLSNQKAQLKTEIIKDNFIHVVTLATSANTVSQDGQQKTGVVIDLETHKFESYSSNEFITKMPDLLNKVHMANKEFFFLNMLSESGLQGLEPVYA